MAIKKVKGQKRRPSFFNTEIVGEVMDKIMMVFDEYELSASEAMFIASRIQLTVMSAVANRSSNPLLSGLFGEGGEETCEHCETNEEKPKNDKKGSAYVQ